MTSLQPLNPGATDPLAALGALIAEASRRDRNEAETRHKIIDFILHKFLAWPKNRVSVEEHIHPGYADYILKKANGDALLFVEAKKEGLYFDLPLAHNLAESSTHISIAKLLTNDNLRAAMSQVRTYCFDTGCEYACVTNGHEWVFFKTFEKQKRWENLTAFVVRSLNFFSSEYTKAVNHLSYIAITERSSLPVLLSSSPPKDRGIYYPKEKIATYAHTITANRLASTLRPIVNRYFGPIRDDDSEFMDRCYVSQREYQNTSEGMRTLIQDSLSPYFESYGVQQLEDTGKGGRLGGRITKSIKQNRRGEVLVLFGGKGSGKSTFIKRLLYHKQPSWLRDHAIIAIIDLLDVPEEQSIIYKTIWTTLVRSLDVDLLLSADRAKLLQTLFSDRFETAKKQELFGLPASSENYNLRLNALIAQWKEDYAYCAKKLMNYWESQGKGVVVVVDNTDQNSSVMQVSLLKNLSGLGIALAMEMTTDGF